MHVELEYAYKIERENSQTSRLKEGPISRLQCSAPAGRCEIIESARFEHKKMTSLTRNVEILSTRLGNEYMAERKKANTPLCISITVNFVCGLLYPFSWRIYFVLHRVITKTIASVMAEIALVITGTSDLFAK